MFGGMILPISEFSVRFAQDWFLYISPLAEWSCVRCIFSICGWDVLGSCLVFTRCAISGWLVFLGVFEKGVRTITKRPPVCIVSVEFTISGFGRFLGGVFRWSFCFFYRCRRGSCWSFGG